MTVSLISSCSIRTALAMPYFLMPVSAGFPSPAQDYVDRCLDLNELCIQHPASTYFVRVSGESMIEAGIFDRDILVVDRSLEPQHGDVVIAEVNAEMTVKQLELRPITRLVARNPAYSAIESFGEAGLCIFGVVTNVVRSLKK